MLYANYSNFNNNIIINIIHSVMKLSTKPDCCVQLYMLPTKQKMILMNPLLMLLTTLLLVTSFVLAALSRIYCKHRQCDWRVIVKAASYLPSGWSRKDEDEFLSVL